ncbi:HAD-IA family hydrolase [Gryllotalpicola reticulitermitis]|uniref:HAD-IA family hydrolase n=1 Tax=Gryllotalpicola reticulitermitis TaxID=1184153 RepID=A0ABV8Q2G2_9MICO
MTEAVPRGEAPGRVAGGRGEYVADAVLFDMDGTLVDSTAIVEAAWGRFADRFGLNVETILAYSHGRQTLDTACAFAPEGADPDEAAADLHEWELVHTEGIIEVHGAAALVRALRGARVAVVTSAPRDLAVLRLRAAGIDVPDVLVCAEDVTAGKPDPAGYLLAASALGVTADRCIVFEDADAGIRAALASGAQTIVVGDVHSEATRPLDRVRDFSAISVGLDADGTVRLRL